MLEFVGSKDDSDRSGAFLASGTGTHRWKYKEQTSARNYHTFSVPVQKSVLVFCIVFFKLQKPAAPVRHHAGVCRLLTERQDYFFL
jgi:hypothetical protein